MLEKKKKNMLLTNISLGYVKIFEKRNLETEKTKTYIMWAYDLFIEVLTREASEDTRQKKNK